VIPQKYRRFSTPCRRIGHQGCNRSCLVMCLIAMLIFALRVGEASESLNFETMNTNSVNEANSSKLSGQACAFAENLAKRELTRDAFAEVVGNQSHWTEFRMVFEQHMRIWQDYTMVTLVVAPDGSTAGWLVESRKESCGRPNLPDADVETRARTVQQIGHDWHLQGVKRVKIDDHRSLAVASFVEPDKSGAYEVYVNHTTGEIIGFLPVPNGPMSPVQQAGAESKAAEQLAWKQIEAGLIIKSGPEAAKKARQAFKLSPVSTLRDASGYAFRVYRLWRYYSTCDVSIEQATKAIVGWYIEALQAGAPERRITEASAVQVARNELQATEGVQGPQVTFDQVGNDEKATVHWWHAEEKINVEGDQTTIFVNAATGKIFSVGRKWRKISRDLFNPPTISREQALRVADKATNHDPVKSGGNVLGQNIIQVSSNPEGQGLVRDVMVWRVGYSANGGLGFTEVSVDCQSGEVVRITGW